MINVQKIKMLLHARIGLAQINGLIIRPSHPNFYVLVILFECEGVELNTYSYSLIFPTLNKRAIKI